MASPQPTPPPIVAPPLPGAPAAREVAFDEAGRIAEDLPCLRCGYNLRGLGSEATCPECASAVGRSIQGDLLRFCDPDWLARLAKGLLLIIIGLLAGFVVSMLLTGLMVGLAAGGAISMAAAMAGAALVAFATSLVKVIGVWWMTTPDPARTEDEQGITARTLARWCIMAELLSSPLQMTSQGGMGFASAGTTTPVQTILMLVGLVVGIAPIVGYLAGLVYLRQLALRIPQPGLAQQTRIVTWGYGCAAVAGAGFGIAMVVVAPGMMGGGMAPALGAAMIVVGTGTCLMVVAGLVFGIWGLVLLFLYRGALSRAAAEARATWARE